MMYHVFSLVFVIAKLFNLIDWSWWLVFSPSIVGVVLAAVVLIVAYKSI